MATGSPSAPVFQGLSGEKYLMLSTAVLLVLSTVVTVPPVPVVPVNGVVAPVLPVAPFEAWFPFAPLLLFPD